MKRFFFILSTLLSRNPQQVTQSPVNEGSEELIHSGISVYHLVDSDPLPISDLEQLRLEAPPLTEAGAHLTAFEGGYPGLAFAQGLFAIPGVHNNAATNEQIKSNIIEIVHRENSADLVSYLERLEPAQQSLAAANNNEALLTAIEGGCLDIAKYLLTIPAVRNNAAADNNKALLRALEGGHLDITKDLLTIPAVRDNAAVDNNEALLTAIENGHLDIVKDLLSISAVRDNAAAYDNYALRWALNEKHLNIARHLLTIPAVRNNAAAGDNDALRTAMKNGHLDIAKDLLSIPAVRDSEKVHDKYLLDLFTLPAVLDNFATANNAVLQIAIRFGHRNIAKYLLTMEAVRDNAAADNNLALQWAREGGYLDIELYLLSIPAVRDHAPTETMDSCLEGTPSPVLCQQFDRVRGTKEREPLSETRSLPPEDEKKSSVAAAAQLAPESDIELNVRKKQRFG